MSDTPPTQITMRIPLERPPTEADRTAAVGIELFEERLRQAGWVDAGGNVLKRFKVAFEGHADGEFYIEWTATLSE